MDEPQSASELLTMLLSHHEITNAQARNLWLDRQCMLNPPCTKPDISAFSERIQTLGMIQLDSIGVLTRAHHHILWSRQSAYRPASYNQLMQHTRSVFEHFSHDAVILPISTYPFWARQQKRRATAYQGSAWGREMANSTSRQSILDHIASSGPVCSRDLSSRSQAPVDRNKHAWMRPAHKLALDYLWLAGELSVSHRENFTKYYDLTERVIPDAYRTQVVSEQEQINWLCESALIRLGFGTAIEIQRFWNACDLSEVKAWLDKPTLEIIALAYRDHAGNRLPAYAPASVVDTITNPPALSSRVRIVNPFDPIVRDRERLSKLFGFNFRIEIYTPRSKRRFGYYVCPILEGNRFIGRIDVRANREQDVLQTRAWWLERNIKPSTTRIERLLSELKRLARLAGVSEVGGIPAPSLPPGTA